MHAVPNKISRVKNAPDYDSARCDFRVCVYAAGRDIRACVHAVPNRIGRVKNAPDFESLELGNFETLKLSDIRVCVHTIPNKIGRGKNAPD